MFATKLSVVVVCVIVTMLVTRTSFTCDDPPRHYQNPCRAATPSSSAEYFALMDAQEFLRTNKVNLDILQLDAVGVLRAMMAGEIDIAFTSSSSVLSALLSGSFKAKIIATPRNRLRLDLWTRSSIRSIADLRGRQIGVGGPGSGFAIALEEILKERRLQANDFKLLPVPITNQRLDYIFSEKIVAAMFPAALEPVLRERGVTKLASHRELVFARDVIAVSDKEFAENRDRRFLGGLVKSIGETFSFFSQEKNRERAIDLIARQRRITREQAQRAYTQYLSEPQAEIDSSLDGMKAVFRDMEIADPKLIPPQAKSIRLEDFVTQDIMNLVRGR